MTGSQTPSGSPSSAPCSPPAANQGTLVNRKGTSKALHILLPRTIHIIHFNSLCHSINYAFIHYFFIKFTCTHVSTEANNPYSLPIPLIIQRNSVLVFNYFVSTSPLNVISTGVYLTAQMALAWVLANPTEANQIVPPVTLTLTLLSAPPTHSPSPSRSACWDHSPSPVA